MFRTITAKYAGICKRCNGPISIGQKIRYAGYGRTYHLASECPKGTGYTDDPPTSHLGNYDAPPAREYHPISGTYQPVTDAPPAETVIELEF